MYSFDAENHRHTLDGRTVPGVTTVIKTLNPVTFDEEGNVSSKTDMLMAWAVKLCVGAFADRAQEYIDASTKKAKEEIVKQVKRAHKGSRDAAGTAGKDMHSLLESIIKGEKVDVPDELADRVAFVLGFLKRYKVVASEMPVYSQRLGYAGIMDLLLQDEHGKLFIADFKTSKGAHNEFFAQLAGYDIAYQEMHCKQVAGYIIVHIPASGDCRIITNEDRGITMESAADVFLATLRLYKNTIKWRTE
jgi:hypothetical protein